MDDDKRQNFTSVSPAGSERLDDIAAENEEMMQEFQKGNVESLTVRDEFVAVFFPTFDPVLVHRSEAISQLKFG